MLTIIMGCNSNKKSDDWDKDNTREVEVGDTIYVNAIRKAKENLPVFLESFKQRKLNNYEFYIKSRYSEGKEAEHMWFIVDSLKKESLIGILDNVPLKLKNIKLNDKLEIGFNEIEDWVIYKADSIVAGNYIAKTIK
jgi:uncharacterized protein YegJ (DUF2314 family)